MILEIKTPQPYFLPSVRDIYIYIERDILTLFVLFIQCFPLIQNYFYEIFLDWCDLE